MMRAPYSSSLSPTCCESVILKFDLCNSCPRSALRRRFRVNIRGALRCNHFGRPVVLPILAGGGDKRLEKRMGRERARFKFRMELASEEPRMVADFHNLHIGFIRRRTCNFESVGQQHFLVLAIEFIAVAVPLRNLELPVSLMSKCARL